MKRGNVKKRQYKKGNVKKGNVKIKAKKDRRIKITCCISQCHPDEFMFLKGTYVQSFQSRRCASGFEMLFANFVEPGQSGDWFPSVNKSIANMKVGRGLQSQCLP